MPSLNYGFRTIRLEQRHFWADGGDDFFIVSASLADVIAAIDITEDSYSGGSQPDWENRWNKVTVIAGLATSLPQHAEPADDTIYEGEVWRTEPNARCKHALWWVNYVPEGANPFAPYIRAFNKADRADRWLTAARAFGVIQADKDHLEDVERDGFWGG